MHLDIIKTLKAIPPKPGVYLFKNSFGKLLYIGKAKNLKNRVSSYFNKSAHNSPRIQSLIEQITQIDYIVTISELEALILEANMIKTERPRYNILMRDDKKYPWLVLTDEPFPRLEISRSPCKKGKVKYFGPYASPGALYETLNLIKKIFPLRQRKKPVFKDRPCMNYHIGSCLGPCQNLISQEEYLKIVSQLELFLKGHAGDLIKMLRKEMEDASKNLMFEKAAQFRNRLQAVQKILERQRVMYDDPGINQDIIGMTSSDNTNYIAFLKVRQGRLIHTSFFELSHNSETIPEEAYESFLFQYYEGLKEDREEIPSELILQYKINNRQALSQWLSSVKQRKVGITVPQRGRSKDIMEMAIRNAEELCERAKIERQNNLTSESLAVLTDLKDCLKLAKLPQRIECYDISHISGTYTVASMVVFTDGKPDKKAYRRFRIQSTQDGKPDDFKAMHEVIRRRFARVDNNNWLSPDLVLIDGGKGQLNAAMKAFEELGIKDQPIISLAKKFEEIYIPYNSRPIILERSSKVLFLIQKIRDEAHRFAISYHRTLRSNAQKESFLDNIKGIGPVRKKRLVEQFGSIEALAKASLQEIAVATNTEGKTAESIYKTLQQFLK